MPRPGARAWPPGRVPAAAQPEETTTTTTSEPTTTTTEPPTSTTTTTGSDPTSTTVPDTTTTTLLTEPDPEDPVGASRRPPPDEVPLRATRSSRRSTRRGHPPAARYGQDGQPVIRRQLQVARAEALQTKAALRCGQGARRRPRRAEPDRRSSDASAELGIRQRPRSGGSDKTAASSTSGPPTCSSAAPLVDARSSCRPRIRPTGREDHAHRQCARRRTSTSVAGVLAAKKARSTTTLDGGHAAHVDEARPRPARTSRSSGRLRDQRSGAVQSRGVHGRRRASSSTGSCSRSTTRTASATRSARPA